MQGSDLGPPRFLQNPPLARPARSPQLGLPRAEECKAKKCKARKCKARKCKAEKCKVAHMHMHTRRHTHMHMLIRTRS